MTFVRCEYIIIHVAKILRSGIRAENRKRLKNVRSEIKGRVFVFSSIKKERSVKNLKERCDEKNYQFDS